MLWKHGRIVDLGTFGGAEGLASGLNDHDQVIGVAANTTPDESSMLGWGVQARAFLWQHGSVRDLGTLGGPDSFAWFINKAGQVAGVSYTGDHVDPNTGQPPVDAFLWQHGQMQDLGSLGGSVPTFGGVVSLNNRGEVVGQSDLVGDQHAHPFLWNGERMIDLGTLGGTDGTASQINQAGAVAGIADLPDQTHNGFLWIRGVKDDLPPLAGSPCSNGFALNNHNDVVGNSTNCHGADVSAGQPFTTVKAGGGAGGVHLDPATHTVYVVNYGHNGNPTVLPGANTLSVVNAATCTPTSKAGGAPFASIKVGPAPADLTIDPATDTLYVTNTYDYTGQTNGTVSVVNARLCNATQRTGCHTLRPPQVPMQSDPDEQWFDQTTGLVWITNQKSDTVSVIDTHRCSAANLAGCANVKPRTIALTPGSSPDAVIADPATRSVYVVDNGSNDVTVLPER